MTRPTTTGELTDVALVGLAVLIAAAACCAWGAHVAAVVTGQEPPAGGLAGAARMLTNAGDPSAAWGTPTLGPLTYWTIATVLLLTADVVVAVWWWWRRDTRHRSRDPRRLPGTATRPTSRRRPGPGHAKPNIASCAASRDGHEEPCQPLARLPEQARPSRTPRRRPGAVAAAARRC